MLFLIVHEEAYECTTIYGLFSRSRAIQKDEAREAVRDLHEHEDMLRRAMEEDRAKAIGLDAITARFGEHWATCARHKGETLPEMYTRLDAVAACMQRSRDWYAAHMDDKKYKVNRETFLARVLHAEYVQHVLLDIST